MNAQKWKVYYWDFFGPSAQIVASHHRQHLDEFLAREGLTGCQTGLESAGAGHQAAWCKAPPELQEMLERTLKPKRIVEVEHDPGELEV